MLPAAHTFYAFSYYMLSQLLMLFDLEAFNS